jgi:iron-sulfur cluster assembly accessory protein
VGRQTQWAAGGKNTGRVFARFLLHICLGAAPQIDKRLGRPTVRGMITLTSRAARQVRAMQAEQTDAAAQLRVFVEGGGCSGFQYGMSFDRAKADDQVVETEGVQVLLDPTSLAYLAGTVIDFDDGLHGKGFELKNPNAQSTCGCGKSFN